MKKKLMIIAGEASGDLHGSSLITELKRLEPSMEIFGIGGDKMISAGMNAQFNIRQMAFLGFIEVLRHLPFISRVRKELLQKIALENIETVVLIDYPGFNLNLAKKLKERGVKVIYFISPQVWAWGKGRIDRIRELVDLMIVVFPFEEKMYRKYGVNVAYSGHPLIEHAANYSFLSKEELYEKLGLEKEKEILLLLPGSRKHEIDKIFPACISAAEKLCAEFNLQTVIACSENIDEHIFQDLTGITNYKLAKGFTYDLLKHSHFGIIKSGTSTLEAALFRLPFIVVYKTNFITYVLGRILVQIKNIAMANIILEENVIDELIQYDVNDENIFLKSSAILGDEEKYNSIRRKLGLINEKLGGPGASAKAAGLIFARLNETN
ncbi:MAG: lipid-A-disaccharide synthase [Ignavibacteriae bacterium HGW-Ignavibacteriae-3]|nr:MAG: lipid-A-disaccharide synthase [Ignavibacteriae bacterium HGW-Ignavibacteriae-3]